MKKDELVITLRTEAWRNGSRVRFRTRVPARDATVLSHGEASITD